MRKPSRKTIKITLAALCLVLLAGGILCIFLPTVLGYPGWVCRIVERSIKPPNGTCAIQGIVGNVFSGFEIRSLELSCPTEYGTFQAEIPHASLTIRPLAFLKGQIKPKTFNITGGTFHLNLPEVGELKEATVTVGNLSCDAQSTTYGALKAQISGLFSGISISLDANIQGFYDLILNASQADAPVPEINPLAVALLHNANKEISDITTTASDVYITMSATGNFKQPDQMRVTGTLGLAEAFVKGRLLPKASGKFSYGNYFLNFSDLHILYNSTESLWCQAALNFESSSFHCTFQADLMPETLLTIMGVPLDYAPKFISFTSPVHINGEVPEASWKDALFNPEFSFDCNDILMANQRFPHLSGIMKYSENTLDVRQLLLTLDDQKKSTLGGAIKLTVNDNRLSGNLSGRIDISELLHGLDIIQTRHSPVEAFTDANIHATLEPSPANDWRNWVCDITATQATAEFAELPIRDISLSMSLKNNAIDITANAAVNSAIDNLFTVKARTVLPDSLKETPLTISIQPVASIQNQTALSIDANITLDWQTHGVSAQEGTGTVRPELFHTLLASPLKFGKHNPIGFFQCTNPQTPIRFTFSLPAVHWRNRRESWNLDIDKWQVVGNAKMPQVKILKTAFECATGDFVFDDEKISLRNVHGELADNAASADLELDFWYSPFRMKMQNLDFTGDPSLVAPLTYDDEAIEIYHMVWDNFHWKEGHAPHITVKNLEFINLEKSFDFTLDGNAQLEEFLYGTNEIQALSTDVKLNLPEGGLDIQNARMLTAGEENATLEGNAHFDFQDGINGSFTIAKSQGTLELINCINAVMPAAKEYLKPFKIAPEAEFLCNGRFRYANFLTLNLNGTLDTPFLQYRNIQLQNMKGTWRASNRQFLWDFPEAEFYGGKLACTGKYDLEAKDCEFLARASEIPLEELFSLTKGKLIEEDDEDDAKNATDVTKDTSASQEKQDEPKDDYPIVQGKLNADGHFRILKDWAGRPLHLEGDGKIDMTDADLWRIPTLTTLGKILAGGTMNLFSKDKIASLGKISALSTNFQCHGNRIDFQNIRTDGSIIALKGEGQYYLDDNSMDFQISGQLLKSVSIISLLLKPVTWAFDAELTGTPQSHQWHLRTPLSRLLE